MTNDLLVIVGHQNVRKIREEYHLQSILKYHNCNIGRPIWPKLTPLLLLHLMGNTFVVKTHSSPTQIVKTLAAGNILKSTYLFRDPRDVAVSAFEHGKELRRQGHTHSFTNLYTIEDAILATRNWLSNWEAWVNLPNTAVFRYEDLVKDTAAELGRLVEFLDLNIPSTSLSEVITTYQPINQTELSGKGLHFNKGGTGRFRQVMTPKEIDFSIRTFGHFLIQMGYEV